MVNIAIFASGAGSNAQVLINYFRNVEEVQVALIVSNKADAGVLQIARSEGIPELLINRGYFYDSEDILSVLSDKNIHLIVLAGFLWLIPPYLVRAFPRKMLNIHPALLPKYGGKGMYGMRVHEAVKVAGETESGISIHFVNEAYDEGDVLFQATCAIAPEDGPLDIARKVQALEHRHYPEVVAALVQSKFR